MSLTFDFETQGHTHSSYDLAYLRQYASYKLDLGADSNILTVRNLWKSICNLLTLMVDGDFQGQTNFSQMCIIFKVNYHSYIICFRFAEFLDLDYVEIDTKIKSVACIKLEKLEVIWKYVWPWFSRWTIEVRRHMLVILRFRTSDLFKWTPTLCLYHIHNLWWTRGHNKKLLHWFSRSSSEVNWQILITARSVASKMKLTRRYSMYLWRPQRRVYTTNFWELYCIVFVNLSHIMKGDRRRDIS